MSVHGDETVDPGYGFEVSISGTECACPWHAQITVMAETLIDAKFVDYLILATYFAFVLGIGFLARRHVSDSVDFFLSGRSLPAWVTGLAFISANLGAVEIMGMSASGAEFGLSTVHYFWVGAIPAMLFLGVVMMPFYYGSKVRSVPEFMLRRFGPGAHLVNSISFAVAQLLIAGVNLYLLATIVHALLGWSLWVALIVAAIVVLTYITLGGLSAAIYNEVLQFFVIVAGAAAAHPDRPAPGRRLGRADRQDHRGRRRRGRPAGRAAAQQLAGPGAVRLRLVRFWSVVGIVFGLGFVLSFGYWTTNFVEVQRALASDSISVGPQDAGHRVVPEDVRPVHHDPARHDRGGPGHRDRRPQGRRDRHRAAPPARASRTTTRCST